MPNAATTLGQAALAPRLLTIRRKFMSSDWPHRRLKAGSLRRRRCYNSFRAGVIEPAIQALRLQGRDSYSRKIKKLALEVQEPPSTPAELDCPDMQDSQDAARDKKDYAIDAGRHHARRRGPGGWWQAKSDSSMRVL
jgi:hypothetical protein